MGMIGFNKKIPRTSMGRLHRSVYLPVMRDQLPDVLRLFDFAEPSLVTGKRDSTNVPPQSLYLMNSDFIKARAAALAKRISQEAKDEEARIETAYQRCFNRAPTKLRWLSCWISSKPHSPKESIPPGSRRSGSWMFVRHSSRAQISGFRIRKESQ